MQQGDNDGWIELAFVAADVAADGEGDAIAPSETSRARLVEAVAGVERYAPFAARVASLFELDLEAARALLGEISTTSTRWRPGPGEGTACWNARSPATKRGAQTMFLRVEPGHRFPMHRHGGVESVLVLEGAYRSSDGGGAAAGDLVTMERGTTHDLLVSKGGACVCAVRLEAGIELVDDEDPARGDPA